MSGRGRGRGRGRGGQVPSQSKLLLKRSAQEAGLDSADNNRQMMSLTEQIVHPPLFPKIAWHSSGSSLGILGARVMGSAAAAAAAAATTTTLVAIKEEGDAAAGAAAAVTPAAALSSATLTSSVTQPKNDQQQKPSEDDVVETVTSPNVVKRPSSIVALIQKQRHLMDCLVKSSHYIRPNQTVDIVRYNGTHHHHRGTAAAAASTEHAAPDQAVLWSLGGSSSSSSSSSSNNIGNTMGAAAVNGRTNGENTPRMSFSYSSNNMNNNKLATDERYFPAELLFAALSRRGVANKQPSKRARTSSSGVETELDKTTADDTVDHKEEENKEGDEEDDLPEEPEEAEEVEDYTMNYYASEDESDDGDGEATF